MNKFKSVVNFYKFTKIFAQTRNIAYFCDTNLKANHNKDYSVVKTFEAGQLAFFVDI